MKKSEQQELLKWLNHWDKNGKLYEIQQSLLDFTHNKEYVQLKQPHFKHNSHEKLLTIPSMGVSIQHKASIKDVISLVEGLCIGWPHLMYSGFKCSSSNVSNLSYIRHLLNTLPEVLGMQILGPPVLYNVTQDIHEDVGITGTAIITTSHLSIHTFPQGQRGTIEQPFFTFDCYSCKDFDSDLVCDILNEAFQPEKVEKVLVHRLNEEG